MSQKILFPILSVFILSVVACTPDNIEPSANAGIDQVITLPTDSVTLNGNASSDPDGKLTSYRWKKISGPSSFTINNALSVTTLVKNLAEGSYEFELEVIDDRGGHAGDKITIVVNPAPVVQTNRPPTAIAGQDLAINVPASSITLDGRNSFDPDSNAITFNWTKIAGPPGFSIVNPSASQTQVNNLEGGVYLFELAVSDNSSLTHRDTVRVLVNRPPVANAGADQSINITSSNTHLNGAASFDPDGNIHKYLWVKISGPSAYYIPEPFLTQAIVANYTGGIYKFELTVTDSMGLFAKDTFTLQINDFPVANAGSDQIILLPLNSVTLNGSGSADPENNITTYSWTMAYGPSLASIANPSSTQTLVNNLAEGDYIFALKVTDAGGLSSTEYTNVRVDSTIPNNIITFTNLAWTADCKLIVNNFYSTVAQGQSFKVYVKGIYPDGTITNWRLARHVSQVSSTEEFSHEIIGGTLYVNAVNFLCDWDDPQVKYTVGIVIF